MKSIDEHPSILDNIALQSNFWPWHSIPKMLPEGTAQRDVTVRNHRPYMGGFSKLGTPKTMGCNTQMVYDLGVPAHDLGNLHDFASAV